MNATGFDREKIIDLLTDLGRRLTAKGGCRPVIPGQPARDEDGRRAPQDLTDLVILFRHLKIRRPEQAVGIAERMYGDDSVVLSEPKESLLLVAESVLARLRADNDRCPPAVVARELRSGVGMATNLGK